MNRSAVIPAEKVKARIEAENGPFEKDFITAFSNFDPDRLVFVNFRSMQTLWCFVLYLLKIVSAIFKTIYLRYLLHVPVKPNISTPWSKWNNLDGIFISS